MATFYGEGTIRYGAAGPDSRLIVAGDASGRVHFLRLEGPV
jgi:hypothetical protein